MMGAAWATVGGYAVMAVLGYRFANRHYPIPFRVDAHRRYRTRRAAVSPSRLSRVWPESLPWSSVLIKVGALAILSLPRCFDLRFFPQRARSKPSRG